MKRYRIIIVGFIIVSMLSFVTACSENADNMGYDCVYNTELGYIVKLGMTKDKIDDLLGKGEKGLLYYEYPDGLSIEYSDGKAIQIQIEGLFCPWEVKEGIHPGDSIDAVWESYGEQETKTQDLGGFSFNILQYYPDKNGEHDILNNVATISFEFDEEWSRVENISLWKR